MPPRKEICRNFARGSCQYGDRCKFLHIAPQQSKPNSLFGSGMQSQQQKPNPFGFGVNNAGNGFGSNQNQFKPFENKWIRSSATNNNTNSTASRRPDNQPPQQAHKCTDPESCKRDIVEDLQNERPMWKLTCYGHYRNGPCDIVGDISYEELRAAAYDDVKRGLNIQSIVERERNLLQAKLAEFESLVRNPYVLQNPFSGGTPNTMVSAPSGGPPVVSSFSQLGASANGGPGFGAFAPSSNLFGQSNAFQNLNQGAPPNNTFGQPNPFNQSPPSNNAFAQPNAFQNLNQSPPSNNAFAKPNAFQNLNQGPPSNNAFGQPNSFQNAGALASNVTPVTLQNPFNSSASISNGGNAGNRTFFNSVASPQISNSAVSPFSSFSSGPIVSPIPADQSTGNIQLMNGTQRQNDVGDGSIWTKPAWTCGEIPEDAPPDNYIF